MQVEENVKPLSDEMGEKMEQYRQQLLNFEMLEPTKRESSDWHWFFYKPITALTAFIVNLRRNEYYIEVVYGYASTAFTRMAGDENAVFLVWLPLQSPEVQSMLDGKEFMGSKNGLNTIAS